MIWNLIFGLSYMYLKGVSLYSFKLQIFSEENVLKFTAPFFQAQKTEKHVFPISERPHTVFSTWVHLHVI